MVKNIMRDPLFLSQKSETVTKEDLQIGRDLMDTLRANRERCVGMAANMIGVKKNIMILPGRNSTRNYPAGLHRLYSMKWIICLEGLFKR